MTNLHPASRKLRRRAVRMVMELGAVDEAEAERLLEAAHGSCHDAIDLARGAGGDGNA